MTKISIVIPIYNVEKYLRVCLDSVINQTYKNLEIICVDDCGNDNSIKIVNEYIKKDNRIKLIQHSSNRGLGPARNTGLDNATGEYIFFLDSDDYLMEDAIEILYNKIKETNSDFVVTRAEAFADDDSEETIKRTESMNNWLDKKELDNYQVNSENYIETLENFNCVSWGKLFKKEFLTQNNLRFIDGNYVHEDNGFWIKVLSKFPKMSYISNVGLMYRIRKNALTAEIDKKKNKNKKLKHMKIVLNDSFNYLKNNSAENLSKKIIKEIKNSEFYSSFFEIKTWYLRFRWLISDKRINVLGIPIYRMKMCNYNIITKVLGFKISSKEVV